MKHTILKTLSIITLAFSLSGAVNASVAIQNLIFPIAQNVPEPPMLLLIGAAFIGLVARKHKR